MPRRPVAASLFAGLFAIQLVLAGVSGACSMRDHAAAASPAAEDMRMADMTMADMPMTRAGTTGDGSESIPCDHPVSPDRCQTMAPCVASYVLPRAVSLAAPPVIVASVAVAFEAMPLSASLAPEPPPPRA